VLRSSRDDPRRRSASSRGREHRAGRCVPSRKGDVRDDGVCLAMARAGANETRVDGALRARHRCEEEVRRIEHPGAGRLECGARARGSEDSRAAAQGRTGERTVRGRAHAPAGPGGARIDRRVRARGASQDRGAWAHAVRGALEAPRPGAREPSRARIARGGDALCARSIHFGRMPTTARTHIGGGANS
jgi:hypothetical protein